MQVARWLLPMVVAYCRTIIVRKVLFVSFAFEHLSYLASLVQWFLRLQNYSAINSQARNDDDPKVNHGGEGFSGLTFSPPLFFRPILSFSGRTRRVLKYLKIITGTLRGEQTWGPGGDYFNFMIIMIITDMKFRELSRRRKFTHFRLGWELFSLEFFVMLILWGKRTVTNPTSHLFNLCSQTNYLPSSLN